MYFHSAETMWKTKIQRQLALTMEEEPDAVSKDPIMSVQTSQSKKSLRSQVRVTKKPVFAWFYKRDKSAGHPWRSDTIVISHLWGKKGDKIYRKPMVYQPRYGQTEPKTDKPEAKTLVGQKSRCQLKLPSKGL